MPFIIDVEHMSTVTLVAITNDISRKVDSLRDDNLPQFTAIRDFERLCGIIELRHGTEYKVDHVRAIQNW